MLVGELIEVLQQFDSEKEVNAVHGQVDWDGVDIWEFEIFDVEVDDEAVSLSLRL